MPIPNYGLLRGKVVESGRETDNNSPHFQIVVLVNDQRWRVPVNVRSNDGSEVEFVIVDPLASHPVLGQLPGVNVGFTPLPEHAPGLALDFVREPLFDFTNLQHLPHNEDGESNDLQDFLETLARRAQAEGGAGAELYVWGSKFGSGSRDADNQFRTTTGVHNIHMNQGNPPGRHFGDNGIYQDGGLIFWFPHPERYIGMFTKFQTQHVQTDNAGEHPGDGTPTPAQPTPGGGTNARVAIIAALVNPAGEDAGNETVTLHNATSQAIDLTGWKIVDRQDRSSTLSGSIEANSPLVVKLDGAGAILANRGGAIALLAADGTRVHTVTYSAQTASAQGQSIRF
jgi:uncharacterized protein YukJ